MMKSMTGFGRSRQIIDGRDILCEVKSVNSRYLDTNIKMPRLLSALEERVKRIAAEQVSRGKMDIYVSVERIDGEAINLTLNKDYLDGYVNLLKQISQNYTGGDVTLDMIAAKNEIFSARKADEDQEEVWNGIKTVLTAALEQFSAMRLTEGKRLQEDLLSNLAELETLAAAIAVRAPLSVQASNERMKARVRELIEGVQLDEARLLTECAIFADKTDINEELARLSSHFSQFRSIIEEKGAVGRKLDFLVQELNREVNTIGSKANDTEIAKAVIDAKCAIERIREQIQNIE